MSWIISTWEILQEAAKDWLEDNSMRMGAALAFYSILSLAPLLLISLHLAGIFFSEADARQLLMKQVAELVGQEGSGAIEEMLAAGASLSSPLAAVIGIVTLLIGASGVFGELQAAMNDVWDVKAKPMGLWEVVRVRFLSFAMVVSTGFLLVVSLLMSTVIAGLHTTAQSSWPQFEPLVQGLTTVVTLAIITILFAAIYKFLPDAQVAWRDVWSGAFLTAILFSIGKLAIGIYLGKSGLASSYGAAGSLVVVIVWVYYSAMIVLFGAQITHTVSERSHREEGANLGMTTEPPASGDRAE